MEIKVGKRYAVRRLNGEMFTVYVTNVKRRRAFCMWNDNTMAKTISKGGWINKKRFVCSNDTFMDAVSILRLVPEYSESRMENELTEAIISSMNADD